MELLDFMVWPSQGKAITDNFLIYYDILTVANTLQDCGHSGPILELNIYEARDKA
jgi:hypothetical protein